MSYNKAYHKHFQGYVERDVIDPVTGKSHIERIYADYYYKHDCDDAEWKKIKVRYGLIYCLSLVGFALQAVCGNTNVWFTGVPTALCMLAQVWLGVHMVSYISHPRLLEVRQYKGREPMKAACMTVVVTNALFALGQIVWMVLARMLYVPGIIVIAAEAVTSALCYRMYVTEREMDYVRIKNGREIPKDSYDIRYTEE